MPDSMILFAKEAKQRSDDRIRPRPPCETVCMDIGASSEAAVAPTMIKQGQ